MKVVLFCGGLGMRLREYSDNIPKPMVQIGYRPILWNIMKYYAHYGHKDFILCLGHKADLIKNYFVNYNEYVSNDFVFSHGGQTLELLNRDIDEWKITFVDTGLHSNIGQRLVKVKKFLKGEKVFLANYSDGLTDMNLPRMIEHFYKQDKIASFLSYRPNQSFHLVKLKKNDMVTSIHHIGHAGLWINTGYFILKREIFNYMNDGDELVEEPFQRLIKEGELTSFRHNGFWASLDTFKDKQKLDEMYSQGNTHWEVWNTNNL
ncbi:glucose-1-phosphate cytidylyltransferase [bacterium BMS3Abin15]|nr:glucose-1-phosphate cytidylyltransferase [bacterium BMS3Abin15]